MASPTYYAAGTITVANGSASVTGVGTAWEGKVYPGDLLADPTQPLVPPQLIIDVIDDTHLTLWVGWPGTSIASGGYQARITPDAARVQEKTRQLLEALSSASNVGFDPPVGMSADDVQAALEELFSEIDGAAPQATTYSKSETDTLVGNAAAGVASRGTVRAASVANITLAAPGAAVDGVAMAAGNLFMAKNQAAPAEVGVYVWNGAAVPATRAAQFDSYDEHPGSLIVVQEGTVNADSFWYCTSNKGGTLGTTAIAFAQLALVPPDGSITYAKLAAGVARRKLTAAETCYVGFTIPTPTISIATPAVVTSVAHGLTAGMPVVFDVPRNTTPCTISAANPGVVTTALSLAAGRPVVFSSNGSLPYGLVEGTTYYKLASGQVAATVGGAAISTAPAVATFTNGSANIGITNASTYYRVGQRIRFATTGGLPTNFAAATDYYILSVSSTTITVSATPGGAAITAGSAGTGTQTIVQAGTHYVTTAGALPTGITEGVTYYVIAAGLGTDTFQVSTTFGGAAVNTSGAVTGSPIYHAYTGSSSGDGSNSRTGAFITLQKAVDYVASLDRSIYNVDIRISAGVFNGCAITGWGPGSGSVTFIGAGSANTEIRATAGRCFEINSAAMVTTAFKMSLAGGDACLFANYQGKVQISSDIEFGAGGIGTHIYENIAGRVDVTQDYTISGGATNHIVGRYVSTMEIYSKTVTLIGTPAFSSSYILAQSGAQLEHGACTFVGPATGKRYDVSNGGWVNSGGVGANYFPGNVGGTGTNFGASPYGLYT